MGIALRAAGSRPAVVFARLLQAGHATRKAPHYTLDLAAPLVTVLAEAKSSQRTTYVYGLGDSPLASDDGSAWIYLSGRDALNSVRQETDSEGQVLAARSFDPYGVVLSGDGGEPFGFTGEYTDDYKLVPGIAEPVLQTIGPVPIQVLAFH